MKEPMHFCNKGEFRRDYDCGNCNDICEIRKAWTPDQNSSCDAYCPITVTSTSSMFFTTSGIPNVTTSATPRDLKALYIVLGVLIFLIIGIVVVVYCLKKKKRRCCGDSSVRRASNNNEEDIPMIDCVDRQSNFHPNGQVHQQPGDTGDQRNPSPAPETQSLTSNRSSNSRDQRSPFPASATQSLTSNRSPNSRVHENTDINRPSSQSQSASSNEVADNNRGSDEDATLPPVGNIIEMDENVQPNEDPVDAITPGMTTSGPDGLVRDDIAPIESSPDGCTPSQHVAGSIVGSRRDSTEYRNNSAPITMVPRSLHANKRRSKSDISAAPYRREDEMKYDEEPRPINLDSHTEDVNTNAGRNAEQETSHEGGLKEENSGPISDGTTETHATDGPSTSQSPGDNRDAVLPIAESQEPGPLNSLPDDEDTAVPLAEAGDMGQESRNPIV